MVLDLLLRDLNPQDYCLITHQNYYKYKLKGTYSSPLPARYTYLQPDFQIQRFLMRCANTLKSEALLHSLLKSYTRQIIRKVKDENCSSIITCTGNLFDLPAGYLASEHLKIPLYIYIFDYYSKNINPVEQNFTEKYERSLFKKAAGIIVPNEYLQEEYDKRYGIKPTVINNPCDLSNYNSGIRPPGTGTSILYTGAVYEAHYDAFRNLIEAITLLNRPELKLHLYTTQSPVKLRANNICGPVINHGYQPVSMMPSLQQEADILFLPLAFSSPYPDIIRTSAPGKIGEYLAAARPILVHAPQDSFISWYFKKHDCGLVVDRNNPESLAEAIEEILENEDLRYRIGRNARIRAEKDFSLEVAKERFYSILETN